MKLVAVILLLSIQLMPSLAQGPIPSPEGLSLAPTPSTPTDLGNCWINVGNCLNDHVNNTESLPELDPTSSSFNITEFFCCSLIQDIAVADQQCFCGINSILHQNPSTATSFIQIFTTCGIVTSIPALDRFCLGEAPSPALAPMMMPLFPGDS